jgi:hypothetical protein
MRVLAGTEVRRRAPTAHRAVDLHRRAVHHVAQRHPLAAHMLGRLLDAVAERGKERLHGALLLALSPVVRGPVLRVGDADAFGHDGASVRHRQLVAVVANGPLVLADATALLEVGARALARGHVDHVARARVRLRGNKERVACDVAKRTSLALRESGAARLPVGGCRRVHVFYRSNDKHSVKEP